MREVFRLLDSCDIHARIHASRDSAKLFERDNREAFREVEYRAGLELAAVDGVKVCIAGSVFL